ncbi:hypothetical protein AgCh_010066 [Apium graveolens]
MKCPEADDDGCDTDLVESKSPTPTVYSKNIWDDADDKGFDGNDEKDEIIDSYLDAWGFERDAQSISTAPSLLANRLIPSSVISNAVPVEETDLTGRNYLQLQKAIRSVQAAMQRGTPA